MIGSLYGGETGQHQIEQDEGIGIEGAAVAEQKIEGDPDREGDGETGDEHPAAAHVGEIIGDALAHRAGALVLPLHVLGEGVMRGEALRDAALDFGQVAALGAHQLLHIEAAVAGDLAAGNQVVGRKLGMVLADAVGEAWQDRLQAYESRRGCSRPVIAQCSRSLLGATVFDTGLPPCSQWQNVLGQWGRHPMVMPISPRRRETRLPPVIYNGGTASIVADEASGLGAGPFQDLHHARVAAGAGQRQRRTPWPSARFTAAPAFSSASSVAT